MPGIYTKHMCLAYMPRTCLAKVPAIYAKHVRLGSFTWIPIVRSRHKYKCKYRYRYKYRYKYKYKYRFKYR